MKTGSWTRPWTRSRRSSERRARNGGSAAAQRRRRARASLRRRPRLEDDDRGPGWAAYRVAIEVVPHLAPAGPEALALVALRRPPMDSARPIGKLDRGVGLFQQIEPPRWLGVFPPVHRHSDQIRTIFVVAEDHAARLAGAAANSREAHRPPLVRLRRPQAFTPSTEPIDRAVYVPRRDHDPAGRQSRRSLGRIRHHCHDGRNDLGVVGLEAKENGDRLPPEPSPRWSTRLQPLYLRDVADELAAYRLDAHPFMAVFAVTGAKGPRATEPCHLRSDRVRSLMRGTHVFDESRRPHACSLSNVGTGVVPSRSVVQVR